MCDKKHPQLPIVERISDWNSRTEIIYKCPECGTSFAALGSHIKFCYNCGTEINWNVFGKCSSEFRERYINNINFKLHKQMMLEIDEMNKALQSETISEK